MSKYYLQVEKGTQVNGNDFLIVNGVHISSGTYSRSELSGNSPIYANDILLRNNFIE